MAHRRKTLNKFHFTMTILQIIFLIGFCTGSEGVGKNVDTTEFKGSSEKNVFNIEPEKQSPAGSQNSEEVEKKKNLSGTHKDDEYIVQEDDEDEVFDDDGYIVQEDESPSDDDFPPNLESKITFASSPNVNTPNEDQVLQKKELYDDAIPTGRKDVYHYGNASPQKQEKKAQTGESNDGGQKTKLSTWEKAELMMMKRNKNKLEKEAKQSEASKKDQIDSNLKISKDSFNIETLENSPSQILSNKSTVETSNDPVTSIDTGVNLPGLIDDDQNENKVDSDESEDSVSKIDISKNKDKITNDKLTDHVNERVDVMEDSDSDTSLTNVKDEHTSTNNVTVEDLKKYLKGVDMKKDDAKKEDLPQMEQETMESGSQIKDDKSHKDFKSDSEGNDDVAFEEEKDIDKDDVESDIKDDINVLDIKNDGGSAKNVDDPFQDINDLTGDSDDGDEDFNADDINEDEVKEINITTHNVTGDAMEHIYPDDEDVEEAFMDHVYPDDDDDVVNSEKKGDIDEDDEETSYDDDENETEDDEESDDSNQYDAGDDDDDAIVDDDISKDKEGVVIVDKNQTDSLTDVTSNNLAGFIDKIDTDQPKAIVDPEEDEENESIMNDEDVFEKMTDDNATGKITNGDTEEVKKEITTDMGQEVKNEESFNATIDMVIGESSEKKAVDDIVSDIGFDDVEGIRDNKHVDDDQDSENKVEQKVGEIVDERTKNDKHVITTVESNNENDSKNISINLETEVTNITNIIDNDNNNNNISHNEIVSNETDKASANESTVESYEDNAKEEYGITDNSIKDIDNKETGRVVENVEPTENKNVDVTEEIENKTVDIVVETSNQKENKKDVDDIVSDIGVDDVGGTLSEVGGDDQIRISDNQQKVKNDDDDDVIKKEFNNETDKGISEASEYEASDNDGQTRNETEGLELQVAKEISNYTTGEIDNIVDDKPVHEDVTEGADEISLPNATFEDVSAHVESIDDDDDDDDDESEEINEETSGEDIDDDIGGDDIVEEDDKIQTNLTDVDAIDDEQIFINNSLSDHPIAIDSTVDKLDSVQSETSKIEEPVDEINDDSNSFHDDENDKVSTTSLDDETTRLADVSNSVEESLESHKEGSDIKADNTLQVDEHFEEVIDKSGNQEASDAQSVEDSKNDDKSDVINSKPEDQMNSNIEGTGPTKNQEPTSDVDSTDVKKEELSDEKPIESKDFLSPVEEQDEHPQTTHEDEGQSDGSVDDLAGALTHGDAKDANADVDTVIEVATEDKKIMDEEFDKEDKYVATEEIDKVDEKLVVDEVEQIFQEMPHKPTNSFWRFITVKPYITLLTTLTNKLDPHITNIISMLPSSVQIIFLKAPFGMYPTHAFLALLFSFFSLFIIKISKMSQVDRENKSRALRESLFEKRGEVLLKQLEKEEADKTLKEVREELAQKEKALENSRAKKDEDLKAVIKDHDALKDEILKKNKKCKDMESEAEKIASDIAKQSLVNKELQESVSSTKEEIQLLQEKKDELQCSIDKSELNSLQLEVNIRRLNDDVCAIKESYDQLSTEVESKKKESEELRSTVDALNAKCSKQSNDIQSKEQDNKALRNAILQLKIMQLLLKENGEQCDDDDDHNDEADGGDDDDDQKKQAIDEMIKHLVYIAQMKCRMDEIEKERLSLRKQLSKEADVRINLNDNLSRTTEEIKKYEQLKENEEHQATKQNIRITVWEQDLKNKENEYTRISLEMKEKERAKSKQKKSAEEKCKEVEKMVADNCELVEQLKAEKEKMWTDYEKQIAQQEKRVQEYQSFAREADREYESKRNLSQILRQKLLIFSDKLHMLESMSSMQKSSESLNASRGKEDERSSSRNLLLRENARPPISPLPPPHFLPEFLSRFPPPPSILFDRAMHPSHLMRPRESSPIPDGFRDDDDRHRFHQMRNTPPQRIGPLPAHRYSPPPGPRDKYPSGNNRPQQYMGKGDGSHRASHN